MMVLEISKNYDLSKLSTLRVKAHSDYFAKPSNLDELKEVFDFIDKNDLVFNVLGAGSNVLLSSNGIPGMLICTNDINFIEKINDTDFEVGAGVRMPRLCARVTKESLTGAEWMEGIPGSIGGGIVMNAGAHGTEMRENIKTVKVFNTETRELEEWANDDFAFAYRSSKIDPKKQIIFSAVFHFEPGDKETIREKVIHNNTARTTRQPVKSFTCGCTFKNPEPSTPAGLLIQELGLKGMREGDFVVSNLHGNFIENQGEGTSQQFISLMKKVQKEAFEKRGVQLKPEVQLMGEFSEDERKLWS
jgi:UDP-N-acetylenolpyruvoylglucosamine reductase